MARQWLECLVCQKQYAIGPMFNGCPECKRSGARSPIEVRYDYEAMTDFGPDEKAPGMWRWHKLLPKYSAVAPVSLGEGGTPLCRLSLPDDSVTLLLKNETLNPTWSYKDRASSVTVTIARELGFNAVSAVSTGNHGNSTAAYASAAGMRCVIFCHQDASALQVSLMRLYGARVFCGGRRTELMRKLVEGGSWFPSYIMDPVAGFSSPYGVEGYKTIAFEIFYDLGGRVPDRVFVPVGGGDGLYGVWKGFVELKKLGLTRRLPKMFGSQAEGAAPYVGSFAKGLRQVEPVANPHTVALSIAEETGGQQTLWAFYDSGGAALSATDEEIIAAAYETAKAGYAIEPASASAVACAKKLIAQEPVQKETWVAVGTGAFVKWPETLDSLFQPTAILDSELDSIEELEL